MKTYEQSSSNDKAENYIFSSIPHFSKTQDAEYIKHGAVTLDHMLLCQLDMTWPQKPL